MTKNIINEIANKLCLSPKGILADESTNTIKKSDLNQLM